MPIKPVEGIVLHVDAENVWQVVEFAGELLFGPGSAELKQIQQRLGDVPIVGFYAHGEISQDRIYGYTGVLTLFT